MEEKNFILTHPKLKPFKYFIKINEVLVAISGFIIFVIMCASVVARYILKMDLNNVNEYLFFAMAWLFFMGAGVGAFEKSHLRADFFEVMIKNKTVLQINTFVKNTLELLLYVIFFYCSIRLVRRGIKIPLYTDIHRLPNIIGYAAVCYSGFMMVVYTLIHYIFYIYRLIAGRRSRGPQDQAEASEKEER